MPIKPPTLQTIPLDMILTVGKLLPPVRESSDEDINQITLAALVNDRELLDHLIERYPKDDDDDDDAEEISMNEVFDMGSNDSSEDISSYVARSGNLKILKWAITHKNAP
jgi:hypothetical protein